MVAEKDLVSQTALVWLIWKWKRQLYKNAFAGAGLLDLSKAFGATNVLHVVWEKCFRFSLQLLEKKKKKKGEEKYDF